MLKIAIIGIGNAGNQVANIAYKENIDVYCINTSEKDLDTIDEGIDAFIIGSAEGAGKDRSVAKKYVKQYFKTLLTTEAFTSIIDDKDILFVVSSTGGGTGSGCSIILTDILYKVYNNKIIIPIGILPMLSESLGTQRNTLEYLKELQSLNKPYILYDNNKYKSLPNNLCMEKVNESILKDIIYIRGDFCYRSQYGMIDDADMLKIVSIPGMITIASKDGFKEKDLGQDEKLDKFIIEEMKLNAAVQIDKDRTVRRLGIILNLTENMVKYYDNELKSLKVEIGEPIESFEHYYVAKDEKIPNLITMIASGLSIPDDRVQAIVDRVEEATKALNKSKLSAILDDIDCDALKVNDGNDIDRNQTSNKNDIDTLDFNFDNY